jgi:hypothetical protein
MTSGKALRRQALIELNWLFGSIVSHIVRERVTAFLARKLQFTASPSTDHKVLPVDDPKGFTGGSPAGHPMLLTDEIGGKVYAVGEVRLHKPVITVRELIGVRVDLELEAHREREVDVRSRVTPEISNRELRLNGADKALRPSIFHACRTEEAIARDRLIEAAEQGFLRNRFFILLDDRQAEHLDDELELDKTGQVTFLQLTPLQGG